MLRYVCTQGLFSLSLGVALAVVSPVVAHAARYHYLELDVTHVDLPGTTNDYALEAGLAAGSDDGGFVTTRLVSPGGIQFNADSPTIRRNSFAAILSQLVGTWTAFEMINGQELSFQFSVAANVLDGVPNSLPMITSPANGATVGSPFDVYWDFDNGGRLSLIAFQFEPGPNLQLVDVSFAPGPQRGIRFTTQSIAPGPQPFRNLRIIEGYEPQKPTLTSFAPEFAGDDFKLDLHVQVLSSPITLYVVPEASSMMLIITGAMCLARRGERASARRRI